jgi:hypothetical protein
VDKPEQPLDSLNRKSVGFMSGTVLSDPIAVPGDHTTHPQLLSYIPENVLPHSRSCSNQEPLPLLGQSMALRGCVNKHNRRIANKKLRMRLDKSIQCTNKAQHIFTLLNKEEIPTF